MLSYSRVIQTSDNEFSPISLFIRTSAEEQNNT